MSRASHGLLLGLVALAACGGAASTDPPAPILDPVRDLARSEDAALTVERTLLAPLAHAVAEGRADAVEVLLSPDFRGALPAPQDGASWPDGTAEVREYGADYPGGVGQQLDAPAFAALLVDHARSLGAPERVAFELDGFLLDASGSLATGHAVLELGGSGPDGERAQLEVRLDLALAREDGAWTLTVATLDRATRVACDRPAFRDVSGWTGFSTFDSAENRELFQRLVDARRTQSMGGLTVLDWNHDGFPDVLATRGNQSAVLLQNDGRGGFVPEPHPFDDPRTCPAMALVIDLDGDGRDEIVGSWPSRYEGETVGLDVWTREGDGWVAREDAIVLPNPRGLRRLSIQTVVPFDADGDGDLDLFIAVYGNHLSRSRHYNSVEAHDGGDNHLLINEGDLRFTECSEARGIRGTQYTYVALAFDFDEDGDTDVYEGNDFGPNVLWRNDGNGHFTADDELGLTGERGYTMGATLGDPEGDGQWQLYVSNMSSEQGARMLHLPTNISEPMRASVEDIASGNVLHVQGSPRWNEEARLAGCNEAEWAWGCVFWDPDNDGDQDLVVTNGFTSHRMPQLGDWQTYYWRQVLQDAHQFELGERTFDVNANTPFSGSFNGYERDRLFLNPDGEAPRAGRRFVEAGWCFGLDATHDGRAVAPIDMDGDGDLDLALWTLQGLRLYENPAPPRHFLRLSVRATSGHAAALSAVVEVRAGGRLQRAHVKAVDGFQTQVHPDLHFGLGDHSGSVAVTVRWPDGTQDSWREVPADRRVELVQGSVEVRARPLPRWAPGALPEAAPASGRMEVVHRSGRRAALAAPGQVTVVRLGSSDDPRDPWPEASALGAHPTSPSLVWLPDSGASAVDALPAGVRVLDDDPNLARTLLGPRADGSAWLVFDRDGLLVRGYTGEPPLADLIALLDALTEEATFPDLLIEDGRMALTQGRFREARAQFQRALEQDTLRTDAWDGLARVALAFRDADGARDAWENAVAADPDYALGHFNLGIAAQGRGDLPRARRQLELAVELAPQDERLWLALAELAAQQGDLERTVTACEAAAQQTAEAAPRILQGKALGQLRRWPEAKAAFEDALARDPDAAEARAALRVVNEQMGRGD